MPTMAYADPSFATLTDAVNWMVAALTGTVASVVAILADAALGTLLLSGSVPARRATEVVIGCFVLFSARVISVGLLGLAQPSAPTAPIPVAMMPYTPTIPKPVPYDPYAGASLPNAGQAHSITR